jgi:preprotein translocase subunit Sec61beta
MIHPLIQALIAVAITVPIALLLRKPLLRFLQYFRDISDRKQWVGVGIAFAILVLTIILLRP